MFKTKKLAFTLAEVLITLAIIGVVAAMTIPALMNKTSDLELRSAWKKTFAVLTQAQQQILYDQGGNFVGMCPDYDNICLRDKFVEKMKTALTCNNAVSDHCTVSNSKYPDGTTISSLPAVDVNANNYPAIVTNDGASIKFRQHDSSCSSFSNQPYACGWMQIDVNGERKPNIIGRDIYFVWISSNKLAPAGSANDGINASTDCATGGTGRGCAAKYLYDWK